MFPHTDPTTQLALHRLRVDEMIRDAADHRRARAATPGRHRRFGRWRRKEPQARAAAVTAAA
jgi:hypothetical protein